MATAKKKVEASKEPEKVEETTPPAPTTEEETTTENVGTDDVSGDEVTTTEEVSNDETETTPTVDETPIPTEPVIEEPKAKLARKQCQGTFAMMDGEDFTQNEKYSDTYLKSKGLFKGE